MDDSGGTVSSQRPLGPRLIKRYANRKLYDTEDSRYVTLQQIAGFVRAGEDVRILDNTSKEDLTTVTLAQIIVGEEKKAHGAVQTATAGSLRSFIQHRRERLLSSLREGPVGKLVTKREAGESSEGSFGAESSSTRPVRPISPEMSVDLSLIQDEGVREAVASAVGHVHQLSLEVRGLQSRLEDLEHRLGKRVRKNSA